METLGALTAWPAPLPVTRLLAQLSCALFGHEVDNHRFERPCSSCPACGKE